MKMIKHRFQSNPINIIFLSFCLLFFSQHEFKNYAVTAITDNDIDVEPITISANESTNELDNNNVDGKKSNELNEKLPVNADTDTDADAVPSVSAPENVQNSEKEAVRAWNYPVNDNQEESDLFSIPFTVMYDMGVQAYLEDNWRDCISFFEIALHEFKVYRQAITNCRLQCWFQNEQEKPFYDSNIENLQFFDLILKKTLCLTNCKNDVLRKQYLHPFYIDSYYRERFYSLKPYEYLQACYYKENEYEKAASATYTSLMHDIDNSLMMSNMQFYLNQLKVDVTKIENLEEQPYVRIFSDGIEAYNNEEYEVAVHHLEESLIAYIMAEDECRMFCEGEFDHGNWQPDFTLAIGNHFVNTLYCKQNCSRNLSKIKGTFHGNIFASHYQYLQFAYFKINDIKKACRAVASFQLFYPENEEMIFNVNYYKTEHDVPDNYFTPRTEAVKYFNRRRYEYKLLSYAYEESYKAFVVEQTRKGLWKINNFRTFSELNEQFATNGTDDHGNGACIIKLPINLFKHDVIQIK